VEARGEGAQIRGRAECISETKRDLADSLISHLRCRHVGTATFNLIFMIDQIRQKRSPKPAALTTELSPAARSPWRDKHG